MFWIIFSNEILFIIYANVLQHFSAGRRGGSKTQKFVVAGGQIAKCISSLWLFYLGKKGKRNLTNDGNWDYMV